MTDRYKPVGKLRTYSDERFAPVFIPEGALEPHSLDSLDYALRGMPGGSCIEQTLYERVGCERTEAIELFNFICSESSLYEARQHACRAALRQDSCALQRTSAYGLMRIATDGARLYSKEPVFTASDIISAALMLLEHDIATANENAQAGYERVC